MGTDNPSLCNGRTRLCVRISPEGKLPQGGSGTTSAVFCTGLAATARSLGQNLSAYYFPSVPFWVSKYRYSIAQPFPFVKRQPGFCTGEVILRYCQAESVWPFPQRFSWKPQLLPDCCCRSLRYCTGNPAWRPSCIRHRSQRLQMSITAHPLRDYKNVYNFLKQNFFPPFTFRYLCAIIREQMYHHQRIGI